MVGVTLCQFGQRETRLQFVRLAVEREMVLRCQNILAAAGAFEADILNYPGGIGAAQAVDVAADATADRARMRAAVADGRRHRVGRPGRREIKTGASILLCAPWSFDHVAIDEIETMRVAFGDVQAVAPNLFAQRFRTFLQPGVIGECAVQSDGSGSVINVEKRPPFRA